MRIYNCHTHIFTQEYVPPWAMGWLISPMLNFVSGRRIATPINWILRSIHPFSKSDLGNRLAAMLSIGELERQEDAF